MEGKGKNDRGSTGRRGGGNDLQGHHCFLRFLRPPDEHKNPDWSDFMNCPICCPDWSATCDSRASVFSVSFIRHVNSCNRFELSVEEMLQSLEENGIKSVSFASELMQRHEEQSR